MRLLICLFVAALLLAVPRLALADQVAVLPFASAGGATSADLDGVKKAARDAVVSLNHKLPTDSQMTTAEMAMPHGGGSSADYRAAGRASSSDWVLTGRVESHGASYRLELEVCYVDTGRIETLARDIDPPQQVQQMAEMLALMLRPEGIGNADIPWARAMTPPKPEPKPPVVVKPPPPPPPPPGPPPVRHAYAEGHPIAIGVSGGVLTALSRASNASGSPTSAVMGGAIGYALGAVPGLELRGEISGSVAGPQSLTVDAGARYAIPVVPTARFFAGPELAVGVFGALGGEKTARFLMKGGVVGALGLGERVQLELGADLAYAAGGSAGLLLFGGTARGLVRF